MDADDAPSRITIACRAEPLRTEPYLSLEEFAHLTGLDQPTLVAWQEWGIVLAHGAAFNDQALVRAGKARRLQRDLGLEGAGLALVLDLLDEIQRLRARLDHLPGAEPR
jgi:chaperone modulatory protein CbpM